MNDIMVRIVAVCPEEAVVRVKDTTGYDWEMPDGERKNWQHIPCGQKGDLREEL